MSDKAEGHAQPSARQIARKLFATMQALAIVIGVVGTSLSVYSAMHVEAMPTPRDGVLFLSSIGTVKAVPPEGIREAEALGWKRASPQDVAREQEWRERSAREDGYWFAFLSWIPLVLLLALAAWVRWLVKPEAPPAGTPPPPPQ